MNIYTLFFSPTGNTEKSVTAMAGAISKHIALKSEKEAENAQAIGIYDFTSLKEYNDVSKYISEKSEITFGSDDFVIIGAPVYAGRIPEAASMRLNSFKGNNTPCIIVVSYGNRHYDDALMELKDIAERNGFKIKGAAAVIGRHTFGEIQVDRPNTQDITEMEEFAVKAFESKEIISGIPGNSVYREGGKGGKFRPSTLESCVKCGLCKRNCPVNAINDQFEVSEEGCISCFRCIRNCPVKAKMMKTEQYQQFAVDFTNKLSLRRENEFYL